MILLLYFIPIAIIFIFCYFDMNKGETVEEYLKRTDTEYIGSILTFFPIVNIFISIMFMFLFIFGIFSMIVDFIIDKIKNIKCTWY